MSTQIAIPLKLARCLGMNVKDELGSKIGAMPRSWTCHSEEQELEGRRVGLADGKYLIPTLGLLCSEGSNYVREVSAAEDVMTSVQK